MSAHSPLTAVAELPAFAPLLSHGGKRTHLAVTGLLGASRSLAVGAMGLGRALTPGLLPIKGEGRTATSVVLVAVDGAEAALDVVSDLRAFLALEESLKSAVPGSAGVPPARRRKTNDEERWADPPRAALDALPGELKHGARLETALFPAWDVLPTESDRPEGLTLAGRRRLTERLREIGNGLNAPPQCLAVIAPITALMQPCEAPSETGKSILLRAGAEHDPIMLGRKLADAGYDRVGQVEVRGEYALRGGILDIFPYTADTPYRIDFLGETIESIRPFDPISQRSEEPVEFIAFADASPETLKRLFSPGASAGPYSLLDHLPAGTLVVFQEPGKLRQRAELYAASLVSGRSIYFPLNELLAKCQMSFDTLQIAGGWVEEQSPPDGNVMAGAKEQRQYAAPCREAAPQGKEQAQQPACSLAPTTFPLLEPLREFSISCTTLQRVQGEVSQHAEAWKKLALERRQTFVFCETGGHRHRLQSLFDAAGITPAPRLKLVLGKLSGGFDLREAGLAAACDREILGISRQAPAALTPAERRKHPGGTVAVHHLIELQPGDYVVHAAHGIARYLGLARLEKSGRTEDYLTLLFANDVKLYVPAAHIGWVGKYVGGHAKTELSTLGGKAWARKKAHASKAIRDIAEDLLAVQAARKRLPGIVYPPDHEWQDDFEKAFPYEETPDQRAAISAVKKDMEATFPMDRLICGDVGFGKTEVALRAAFKAVSSGKQAAVLVPTTLLAEQHGRTFKERFAAFPFNVEVLSRFKTPGEQRRLLERLATGRADVVVGTHRLLQKDVHFKDLGLAIIDEEQRFGVEHKEFFKRLRKSIDVLTMTATPIPRTLHMALLGLRDISNLATPPRNRLPVTTKIAHRSDDLLRRAILREISRGGQVFIIHPRVLDIQEFCASLTKLAPEARFTTGHGQMDSDELESVMAEFLHGQIDALVSTTIVESGLDIPTANTIIIHEADRFGLAELHQLRGRVGRSDIQAYCYLLLPEQHALTPEGLRRLRALEEFDELGAGFQLALKDLEIRGTGNILGSQQSGEIAEIGYDLYCKLLDATVRELRGEPIEEQMEVNLQLRGAAYIPEAYVQDDKVVLEIYRRLNDARGDGEVDALKAEVEDRFGPLPETTLRTFEETKLRRIAQRAGVPYAGLDNQEGRLVLKLHGWDLKVLDRALRNVPESKGVRVIDGETLSFGLTLKARHDEGALREMARKLLEALASWQAKETRKPECAAAI